MFDNIDTDLDGLQIANDEVMFDSLPWQCAGDCTEGCVAHGASNSDQAKGSVGAEDTSWFQYTIRTQRLEVLWGTVHSWSAAPRTYKAKLANTMNIKVTNFADHLIFCYLTMHCIRTHRIGNKWRDIIFFLFFQRCTLGQVMLPFIVTGLSIKKSPSQTMENSTGRSPTSSPSYQYYRDREENFTIVTLCKQKIQRKQNKYWCSFH